MPIFLNPFASCDVSASRDASELGFFEKLFYTFNGRWYIKGEIRWDANYSWPIEDLHYYKFHIGIYDYLTLGISLLLEQIPIVNLPFIAVRFIFSTIMTLVASPFVAIAFSLKQCFCPLRQYRGRLDSNTENSYSSSQARIRTTMPTPEVDDVIERLTTDTDDPTVAGVRSFLQEMFLAEEKGEIRQRVGEQRFEETLNFLNRRLS